MSLTAIHADPPAGGTVGTHMGNHRDAISSLHDAIERLEKKLTPVLTSAQDGAFKPLSKDVGPAASPVAEELFQAGAGIDSAIGRLLGLIERVDL